MEQTRYSYHVCRLNNKRQRKYKTSVKGRNIKYVVINKLDLTEVKLCSSRMGCNFGNILTPYVLVDLR